MITNYIFLNRELLEDVYVTLGTVLVITEHRHDSINFFNELLMKYSYDSSAMRSSSDMQVSSKANQVTVRSIANPGWLDSIRGKRFTRIYTVGMISDNDNRELTNCLGVI